MEDLTNPSSSSSFPTSPSGVGAVEEGDAIPPSVVASDLGQGGGGGRPPPLPPSSPAGSAAGAAVDDRGSPNTNANTGAANAATKLVCATCRTKSAAKSCAFLCCSGCCPSSSSSTGASQKEAGGAEPSNVEEGKVDETGDPSSSTLEVTEPTRVCEYHQRARMQSEFRRRVLDGTTSAQLLAKQIRARQLPPGRFRERQFVYQGDTIRIWDWSAFGASHPKALEEAARKSLKRRKQQMRHSQSDDDTSSKEATTASKRARSSGAAKRPTRQDRFRQLLDARLAEATTKST